MQSRDGISERGYERRLCSRLRDIPSLVIGEAPEPRLPAPKRGTLTWGPYCVFATPLFCEQDIFVYHQTVKTCFL